MIKAKYFVDSGLPLKTAGQRICEECSTGTWTNVTTTTKEIEKKYAARVGEVDRKNKIVEILVPTDDFEIGNMPQFLSLVAGNVFGLKQLRHLRLLDVELPKEFIQYYKGPRFGIDGIREITSARERPLVGTIVKPKIGLGPADYAEVVREAVGGGVDLVKMDETLTNQDFCKLEENVSWVMEVIDNYKEVTEKEVLFAVNITTRPDKLLERAEEVLKLGANCLMIDVVCTGIAAIQILRDDPSINAPIYCHRAGHAAFTEDPKHGIHWMVFCKLARLLGADAIHAGTIVGKMRGGQKEVLDCYDALRNDWYGFKPTMPAASGGLYPGLLPKLIKLLGKDIIANFGGGIHGHPDGTKAGAAAVRQALDAVSKNIKLNQYARSHRELKIALERWK